MKDKVLSGTRGLLTEFKSFAIKGNAFDLAIAVVVGNAFTAVVNSLVGDIITPLIGVLTNNVDFKTLVWAPRADLVIKYGAFLQTLFNFLIVSIAIFIAFKAISTMRKRLFERHDEDATPAHQKPEDVRLLEEIRDILQGNAENRT